MIPIGCCANSQLAAWDRRVAQIKALDRSLADVAPRSMTCQTQMSISAECGFTPTGRERIAAPLAAEQGELFNNQAWA